MGPISQGPLTPNIPLSGLCWAGLSSPTHILRLHSHQPVCVRIQPPQHVTHSPSSPSVLSQLLLKNLILEASSSWRRILFVAPYYFHCFRSSPPFRETHSQRHKVPVGPSDFHVKGSVALLGMLYKMADQLMLPAWSGPLGTPQPASYQTPQSEKARVPP